MSAARRSRQTTLGDALDSYIRRVDKGGAMQRASVARVWPQAVGPQIAQHTAGMHMREGELVVYVDSSVWAQELTALSSALVTSLNECLGQNAVRTIRFSVSKKVQVQREIDAAEADDGRFYAADDVEPAPLSEAEIEQVRQSASAIRNADLREAAVRATVKDLEWKRGLARKGSEQGR